MQYLLGSSIQMRILISILLSDLLGRIVQLPNIDSSCIDLILNKLRDKLFQQIIMILMVRNQIFDLIILLLLFGFLILNLFYFVCMGLLLLLVGFDCCLFLFLGF
jgi:hypothetical protein